MCFFLYFVSFKKSLRSYVCASLIVKIGRNLYIYLSKRVKETKRGQKMIKRINLDKR